MGEFFVNALDLVVLKNSSSICLLPLSITSIHLYGFTSISFAVLVLTDFCGITIASFPSSLILSIWRRVAFSFYFLKTNRYSCAKSRKLYLILFVFQYPVALQLCCSFSMISFKTKPASRKTCIVSKPSG